MKLGLKDDDTIVAISTPLGRAGIGIVRMSGRDALSIADKMFVSKNKQKPSEFKSFSVHYGDVVRLQDGCDNNAFVRVDKDNPCYEVIDEALLTVMRAPKSYTREDVVEISSHGGIACLKAILSLAVKLGARLAEPGEFTKRAFLNGRIDLAQAEAVMDIINSKTEAFLRISTSQLKGDLSVELEKIREMLMDVFVKIEAAINFPEDDIGENVDKGIDANRYRKDSPFLKEISSAIERIEALLKTAEQGRIMREGISIVFCGRPNVGKSSLLNALLRTPRAIVSDIPGTTRDTIEESAQIKGVPVRLVDTAGILEPKDLIEEEAIKRSHDSIMAADIILFIVDANSILTDEDKRIFEQIKARNVVVVVNKCDLQQRLDDTEIMALCPGKRLVKVSAVKRMGMEALETAIFENVWSTDMDSQEGIILSNLRHVESLERCREYLMEAVYLLRNASVYEIISEQIRQAVGFLDKITGRNIDTDLLDVVFSRFCIGK